ncbi:MAG TPA: hypothetical protein VM661_09395 [Candidatus Sulfotelmatobacter sp.]|jgi:hypothetical protein|nr:hypothetical protein [Candidatus Sulfotelmatobacter sp.]
MTAILRTILLTNARDRMLPAVWALALAALLASRALGGAMLVEGRETALAYASLSLRLVVVAGLVMCVCFQMRRLQETREIEAMLARPLSRTALVLALAGGYGLLAAAAVLPSVAVLGLALNPDAAGLVLWGASLLLEAWITVAFALFLACSLTSAAASALTALALYALSRMAAGFHDIAQAGLGDALASPVTGLPLRLAAEAMSLVLPRLDLFGQSSWLVYGAGGEWGLGILAAQAGIYLPLLLAATVYDLKGRQF